MEHVLREDPVSWEAGFGGLCSPGTAQAGLVGDGCEAHILSPSLGFQNLTQGPFRVQHCQLYAPNVLEIRKEAWGRAFSKMLVTGACDTWNLGEAHRQARDVLGKARAGLALARSSVATVTDECGSGRFRNTSAGLRSRSRETPAPVCWGVPGSFVHLRLC